VYYKSQPTSIVGVTATIAAIFLSVSFCAIINFGVPLPLLERERPMVYRERTSRLYDTVAYSLAMALVEAPWTALSVALPAAILYGMVGLLPDAGTFFLFLLVHWQLALNFVFVGQWFAFGFPNTQVAQAT
jgi:ABC-type multidrug transport system permease subunit